MRRMILLALLACAVLGSCGATLRVRATAPTSDNDGTCVLPVLIAAPAGAARMMHFAWTGPESGEDSLATTAGQIVSFSRQVRAGTYTVRAWASDAGGTGCDTSLTVVLKAPPAKVSVQ